MELESLGEDVLQITLEEVKNICSRFNLINLRLVNKSWKKTVESIFPFEWKDLRIAISRGNVESLKFLLRSCPQLDPSLDEHSLLRMSCEMGNHEIVSVLILDRRIDPSFGNNLPLRLSRERNHLKVVQVLLKDSRVQRIASNVTIPSGFAFQKIRIGMS
eukprot:TRINITY_DN5093_c0_g1_i2.p1 TRINITY_DN5093_c0_g1~~TRINITY_DN5093_c0_g1_i2.p1  ORF type:complete len:160 (-),score=51.00 TRINITY_DN5093_c0_g1_i2:196-675(-)